MDCSSKVDDGVSGVMSSQESEAQSSRLGDQGSPISDKGDGSAGSCTSSRHVKTSRLHCISPARASMMASIPLTLMYDDSGVMVWLSDGEER
ncbi:hypothetical protein Bca101_036411 [Brassica carinata]